MKLGYKLTSYLLTRLGDEEGQVASESGQEKGSLTLETVRTAYVPTMAVPCLHEGFEVRGLGFRRVPLPGIYHPGV